MFSNGWNGEYLAKCGFNVEFGLAIAFFVHVLNVPNCLGVTVKSRLRIETGIFGRCEI